MTTIDDQIATYLHAIEVEGKTVATQASYANSLAHFRAIISPSGRRAVSGRRASTTQAEEPHRMAGSGSGYGWRR